MKNFKLLFSFIAFAFACAVFGNVAAAAGLNPLYGVGFVTAASIVSGIGMQHVSGVAYTAISITDIVTALGAFYRANRNIIISNLYYKMNLEGFIQYDGITDELPLPKIGTESIVQPANDTAFNPTANAIKLSARTLKVRQWKVDLTVNPRAWVKTWLGFTKNPGTRQQNIPLEQYIMEKLIAQVQEDIALKAIYKGIYNAAGTAPADIFHGVLKIIVDEITATNISPVVTGAITSSNAVDKLYVCHDALGAAAKETETHQHVNSQIFDWAYRSLFPVTAPVDMASAEAGQKKRFSNSFQLPGTNCKVMRKAGMQTSQRIITTLPDNLSIGVDSEGDYTNFEFQRFERSIKILGDGTMGVEIANIHNSVFTVNDQV